MELQGTADSPPSATEPSVLARQKLRATNAPVFEAEAGRFELPRDLRPNRYSKPAPSTGLGDASYEPECTGLGGEAALSRDMAVEVGFEPTEPVKAHALSRRARSAASVLHRRRL